MPRETLVTLYTLKVSRTVGTAIKTNANMSASATESTLVLELASVEDVPAITSLWFDAFTQPVIGELFPDTPAMREWHQSWHRGDMQTKPHQKYLRVVDTASTDEQGRPRLAAFGKWDLAMPAERGRRFPQWCVDSPYQDCEDLIAGLEKERQRVMGDQKHYCMNELFGQKIRMNIALTNKPRNFRFRHGRHSS